MSGSGRAVVVVLASCGLVASFMQTLVVPLIPVFPRLLHVPAADASWVVTVTLLAASVITPVSGRLGDLYGKRRMILVSLGLFGLLIDVERQLNARLLGVRLPPLCFLASANLLDDERG